MAIWQFDLSFVPHGEPTPLRNPDGYEARSFHAREASKAEVWLAARFGSPSQIVEGWFAYGPIDGNRVDVSHNEDGTAEISARIDARVESTAFIDQICELCAVVGGKPFALEFWKLLEAQPAAIGLALERSRAAAFIRDPEKFLKGAGSGA